MPRTILGPRSLKTKVQVPVLRKLPTFQVGECALDSGEGLCLSEVKTSEGGSWQRNLS